MALLSTLLTACSGQRPSNLGVTDGELQNCPSSPNCVSSFATDKEHSIAALQQGELSWQEVLAAVKTLPRTQVIESKDSYIYAECRSRLLGFVDDLELLKTEQGAIQVRSASRLGHSDMGINRKRVEMLRNLLHK